jgi:hypothetical protein
MLSQSSSSAQPNSFAEPPVVVQPASIILTESHQLIVKLTISFSPHRDSSSPVNRLNRLTGKAEQTTEPPTDTPPSERRPAGIPGQ